jgi:hypothetical protein
MPAAEPSTRSLFCSARCWRTLHALVTATLATGCGAFLVLLATGQLRWASAERNRPDTDKSAQQKVDHSPKKDIIDLSEVVHDQGTCFHSLERLPPFG